MKVPTSVDADAAVGRPGGVVVVVDVEARRRARSRAATGRRPPPSPAPTSPLAAQLRRDPDALHLAGGRRHRADLGLEDDPAVLDAGEGPPAADQLGDPDCGRRPAVGRDRRDADLLGEHRHAGGQQHVDLVGPDPAHQRVGGHRRRRTSSPSAAGRDATSRAGPQAGSSSSHSGATDVARAHDRRAAAALAAGPVGEGPRPPPGPASTGTRLAPDVAERRAAGRRRRGPTSRRPSRTGSSPTARTRDSTNT